MLKKFNLVTGGAIVLFLILVFIVSFFYVPHNVNQMNIENRLIAPNHNYLLGTDNFGRDVLSRIMKGTQTAFIVGGGSVIIGLLFGILILLIGIIINIKSNKKEN